jgi:membrane protease YdiL (CAAX protease family)
MDPAGGRAFLGAIALRAPWRAGLFVVAMVLGLEMAMRPVGWLSARGLLASRQSWMVATHAAALLSALLPTLLASVLEGRPLSEYGLSAGAGSVLRFAEGVAWGLATASLLAGILQLGGFVAFTAVAGPPAWRSGALWAVALSTLAVFRELAARGYLQSLLARSLGFWPAASLLTGLFAAESLLNAANRSVLALANVVAASMLACLGLRLTGSVWFAAGLGAASRWSLVFLCGFALSFTPTPPPGTLHSAVVQGASWITGGPDGPEGGALNLVTSLLIALALGARFRRRTESPRSVETNRT